MEWNGLFSVSRRNVSDLASNALAWCQKPRQGGKHSRDRDAERLQNERGRMGVS